MCKQFMEAYGDVSLFCVMVPEVLIYETTSEGSTNALLIIGVRAFSYVNRNVDYVDIKNSRPEVRTPL